MLYSKPNYLCVTPVVATKQNEKVAFHRRVTEFSFLPFLGGLVCFSLRYNELDDYQPKMLDLEKEGRWEKICSKTIPYFERDDLPREGLAFMYKVLRN